MNVALHAGADRHAEGGEERMCRCGPSDRILQNIVVGRDQQGHPACMREKQPRLALPQGHAK